MHTVKNGGFSLIELSVVLTIVGLLVAGYFATLEIKVKRERVEISQERTRKNADILYRFATTAFQKNAAGNYILDAAGNKIPEQRLPCPANINAGVGQTGFGVEQCPSLTAAAGSVFNGVRVAVAPSGQRIFIGALPVSTLETNGENYKDGYRSNYIYAVSASLTQAGSVTSSTPAGSIHVKNTLGAGAPITTQAPFVIVATGQNGLNATSTEADFENLNNDHIFLATSAISDSATNQYYDDYAEFEFPINSTPQFCISQVNVQTFTTPGNYVWRKPTNGTVQYAMIEVNGADGGPSLAPSPAPRGGCNVGTGGGDGGQAKRVLKGPALPASVNVVVGQGGSGGGSCMFGHGAGGMTPRTQANGTPTRFGNFVVLTGGKKAAGFGPGASYPPGTATGADWFLASSIGTNFGQLTCQWTTGSRGGGNQCHTFGGQGENGSVTVTTYLCN